MRHVEMPGFDRPVPALGMGCASLGSRVGRRDGLKALEAVYEGGVRWFDVAPAYGAGDAEDILGEFLNAHGAEAFVCSKVGLAPPKKGPLKRLLISSARGVKSVLGPLSASMRGTKLLANRAMPLTPDLIRTSVETSLRRLGRERLDVYAVHNARAADLERGDIIRALEDAVASGKARTISVAGDLAAAERAIEIGQPFGAVQVGVDLGPDMAALVERARSARMGVLFHSVFGKNGGGLDRVMNALGERPNLAARLEALGYEGVTRLQAASLLLLRALTINPNGVVLASMYSKPSRERNFTVADGPLDPRAVELVNEIHDSAG